MLELLLHLLGFGTGAGTVVDFVTPWHTVYPYLQFWVFHWYTIFKVSLDI
jgi:hypothetical protein